MTARCLRPAGTIQGDRAQFSAVARAAERGKDLGKRHDRPAGMKLAQPSKRSAQKVRSQKHIMPAFRRYAQRCPQLVLPYAGTRLALNRTGRRRSLLRLSARIRPGKPSEGSPISKPLGVSSRRSLPWQTASQRLLPQTSAQQPWLIRHPYLWVTTEVEGVSTLKRQSYASTAVVNILR